MPKIRGKTFATRRKYERTNLQLLRDYLKEFIGKEVLISSNIERAKVASRKVIKVYHIGQMYSDQRGQVLTLENPTVKREDTPQIPILPNMEIERQENKIILRYPRAIPFRALPKRTLPDLEIHIEEVKEEK